MRSEKLHRLIHGHLQYVANGLALKLDLEH